MAPINKESSGLGSSSRDVGGRDWGGWFRRTERGMERRGEDHEAFLCHASPWGTVSASRFSSQLNKCLAPRAVRRYAGGAL